jgi:hypothetical protein
VQLGRNHDQSKRGYHRIDVPFFLDPDGSDVVDTIAEFIAADTAR